MKVSIGYVRHLGSGRYGSKILITPIGVWYWSSTLGDINFVLNGSRRPFHTHYLNMKKNTVPDAIRAACRIMTKWQIVEEDSDES